MKNLKVTLIIISTLITFLISVKGQEEAFISHGKQNPVSLIYDIQEEKIVEISVLALANDLELLTGVRPRIANNLEDVKGDAIIIGSLRKSRIISLVAAQKRIDTISISGKWETYGISSINSFSGNIPRAMVIYGSDRRGAAYGVFDLSARLGVSPWYWWADVHPEKKDRLGIPEINYLSTPPSVRYRGIFINDECWGLQPWSAETYEPEENDIGPRTYARIFELLLRMRANFLWPAMHYCTKAFYINPENPKTAHDYGIVVGSSHIEPLLRNNMGEWDNDLMGSYNFFTNRETIIDYWEERVKESVGYESVYTVGMRGVGDSPMVGGNSIQEQVEMLHEIISEQRKLIEKHINPNVKKVPQAFTAYKEVLDIYDAGMDLPKDITIVWPDDNYGYIHRFSDDDQRNRAGGSGIYYHISYWGRPHDYLWLSSTHPGLIWEEMIKASYFNTNEIWVVNVGDIKKMEYNTSLFLDMAWDTGNFTSSKMAREHFYQWHKNIFGKEAGEKISRIKWEYYNLNFERRPEFMGWSQTESIRRKHFSEYNHFQSGDEAQQRIDHFNQLAREAKAIKEEIPERLHEAFFQLVEYPLVSAGLMTKKFLYMEKAYYYASQKRVSANDYALFSQNAYDSILLYSEYYNNELAGGKWKNMMYVKPRGLPVFDMPPVPQWHFAEIDDWGLGVEGNEELRHINMAIKGPTHLPTFNNLTQRLYFIDIFLKGTLSVEWQAKPSQEWIDISHTSGKLSSGKGEKQQRIWVNINWDKVPEGSRHNGYIAFIGSGKRYSINVYARRMDVEPVHNSHLFIEDNRAISIFAENFNRKTNTENFGWYKLYGFGHTGGSVWVNPLEMCEKKYDPELKNPSTVEYDFFTWTTGKINVTVYCIPIHPINPNYNAAFAVSVNDEKPQILDHQTYGRSEKWKLNVLRNSAIVSSEFQLFSPGRQVLKIHALDPGVIIDRITIDLGGLVRTYSVLPETRLTF